MILCQCRYLSFLNFEMLKNFTSFRVFLIDSMVQQEIPIDFTRILHNFDILIATFNDDFLELWKKSMDNNNNKGALSSILFDSVDFENLPNSPFFHNIASDITRYFGFSTLSSSSFDSIDKIRMKKKELKVYESLKGPIDFCSNNIVNVDPINQLQESSMRMKHKILLVPSIDNRNDHHVISIRQTVERDLEYSLLNLLFLFEREAFRSLDHTFGINWREFP